MSVLWTQAALVAATGGVTSGTFTVSGISIDTPGVSGISIDTRSLRPGDLFVALVGHHGDGHAHVAEAFARGAAAALVHHEVTAAGPTLRVADTLAGLRAIAVAGRARFAGRCIAVTGSAGKTSSKEMLRAMLSLAGPTHAAEGSHNNHWGVPLTLARLPVGASFAVVEIGTNNPGEIAPLARLARPHATIITMIGDSHIGRFGSRAAIALEKASIMAGLEPGGVALLPEEPAELAGLVPAGVRALRFGAGADCAARLDSVDGDLDGSEVAVSLAGRRLQFRLGAPGRHMAMNALACLAAIDALGVDVAAVAPALAGFGPVSGRGARRKLLGGAASLIDESYNAAPQSLRAALDLLRMARGARRVVVLGDMLELGEQGPALHAGLAGDVAGAADLVFACGPLMRHLFEALPVKIRATHADSAAALAPSVRAALRPGDIVLVKGSNGSRMRDVVAAIEVV